MDINEYKNTDYIAHYTKGESCLQILNSMKLWLTPKSGTIDLYERILTMKRSVRIHSESEVGMESAYQANAIKASLEKARTYRCIRQTSFCKTAVLNKNDVSKKISIDGCCFMHPRMWEQYASNYEGVCLILSLSSLKKNNPSVNFNDIKYVGIDYLNQIVASDSVNVEECHTDVDFMTKVREDAINRSLFKALDYSDEREIRAYVVSDEKTKNCEMDIKNALKAIVLCIDFSKGHIPNSLQEQVAELAKSKGVEVLLMKVNGEVSFETLTEYETRIEQINAIVKKNAPVQKRVRLTRTLIFHFIALMSATSILLFSLLSKSDVNWSSTSDRDTSRFTEKTLLTNEWENPESM